MKEATAQDFWSTAKHDFKENFWNRLCYALFTLGIVWAGSGGDLHNFWTRILFLAPLFAVLAWQVLRKEGKLHLLKAGPDSVLQGVKGGILAAVVMVILIYLTRANATLEWASLKGSVLGLLALALIVQPANEILFRGILTPLWGFWSTAFLDAANWTFGTQNFGIFWISFLSAAAFGYLCKRHGLASALVARLIFGLVVWLYIYIQF
jgi:hypothetical protein